MDAIAKASALDREALFRRVEMESGKGWPATIVEKDFWVCWTLRRLFDVLQFRPHLIFKGGTSLSKVYRAIERFSEDVDLSFSRRDLGFADDRGPEQAGISKKEARRRLEALSAECQNVVREKLMPDLRRDFTSALGKTGWSIELDSGDPQTILFSCPSTAVSGETTYVRPVIRLEMGARSDDWPAVDAAISPYAAEVFPDLFALRVAKVRALAAERTFWEKATLLHAECHRPPDKLARERYSRHYYDLYRLAGQSVSDRALAQLDLLSRVVAHMSLFFAQGWAHFETARPGSFRLLPDADRLAELRWDYQEMRAMIYGEVPDWQEIVSGLEALEKRING